MSDPDAPNPTELYQTVLARVKEAGVTDEEQAKALADAVSVGVLEELEPLVAGLPAEKPAAGDGVEKLEQIAEELREERERLEWAAIQVAHLADRARSPSIDPDPTPPDSSPPILDDAIANESVGAPAPDAEAPADGAGEGPTWPALVVSEASPPEADGQHLVPREDTVAGSVPMDSEPATSDADDEPSVADVADGHAPRRRRLLPLFLLCLVLGIAAIVWRTGFVG